MNPKLDLGLRVVLAVALVFMGVVPKLTSDPAMVANFEPRGYPADFYRIVGFAEVAAAALHLIPRTALLGAAGLVVVMLGATATHLKVGEFGFAPIPLAIGAVAAWIGWTRWKGTPRMACRLVLPDGVIQCHVAQRDGCRIGSGDVVAGASGATAAAAGGGTPPPGGVGRARLYVTVR